MARNRKTETLTTTQIAAECGVSVRMVQLHMQSGKLAHYNYGLGSDRPRPKVSTREQVEDWKRLCLVEGPQENRPLHPDFRPGGVYG